MTPLSYLVARFGKPSPSPTFIPLYEKFQIETDYMDIGIVIGIFSLT